VPRITDFCSRIYVFGCKLSLVRLCDSDFGITPVDDISIGITCAACCFHMAHISLASSRYLFCLSVIVLARLYVFGTAMSIKKMFFVFLFIKVMSGRLKGIVLSVSMLRFQYSLKCSFSSTLAGVYYYYCYYYYTPSCCSATLSLPPNIRQSCLLSVLPVTVQCILPEACCYSRALDTVRGEMSVASLTP